MLNNIAERVRYPGTLQVATSDIQKQPKRPEVRAVCFILVSIKVLDPPDDIVSVGVRIRHSGAGEGHSLEIFPSLMLQATREKNHLLFSHIVKASSIHIFPKKQHLHIKRYLA